jgi:tetratricopeptide (TPR) repeat protein
LYESKLAQIKWYLKANKQDSINKPASFILEHAKRWLGDVHPLFVQLNRILAEYFSEHQFFYSKALKYANSSLSMQQAIFGNDNNENLWRDYFLIGKIHYVNSKPEEALNYLVKAKELVKVDKLRDLEVYGELCLMLAKGYLGTKYYKESYVTVKELYQTIKEERDERSLVFIVEAVALIKQLLEINQEHESYYRFVESDFSNIVHAFADYPNLLTVSIKMITIPYLKNVILQKSKNKIRLLNIIEEISKINQLPNSSLSYIKAKITEGTFPKGYLHYLKEIDSVIDEIVANQMM